MSKQNFSHLKSGSMKDVILCLAILIFSMTTVAQQEVKFKEIGLNATPLLHQFLNFSNSTIEISPYVLTYEQRLGKLGFRAGIGLDTEHIVQMPDFDNNLPEVHTDSADLAARAGVVLYKDLSEKWGIKYGMDFTYAVASNIVETYTFDFFGNKVVNTVSETENTLGLSPFVFVQYRFNPHFSMGTELLGHANRSNRTMLEESSQFPEFNTEIARTAANFGLSAPTALFFIFRF